MSSYSELIKNFERIRSYMREFYVYGFRSRSEFSDKSLRSYDDERRRIESWMGEHMSFVRGKDGKNIFLSIDSREISHNPLYKAWKTKSFTDKDITLHFILFDILCTPDVALPLSEVLELTYEYLAEFDVPMEFDESTVRKKLKEYVGEGIIISEKRGKAVYYRRADDYSDTMDTDVLHYFSEVAPCGAIGSFLLDKAEHHEDRFVFKHHYITSTLDSDVLCGLFDAMHKKSEITVTSHLRNNKEPRKLTLIPLRVFISVQNGRQHLLAYDADSKSIRPFRIDYLSDVNITRECPDFDYYRESLSNSMKYMWGVNCRNNENNLGYVDFIVRIDPDEDFIVRRLYREKRIGTIEQIDSNHYRFYAQVYDVNELVPWIRTFICRIESIRFSDREAEKRFRQDIEAMYRMYGVEGGEVS